MWSFSIFSFCEELGPEQTMHNLYGALWRNVFKMTSQAATCTCMPSSNLWCNKGQRLALYPGLPSQFFLQLCQKKLREGLGTRLGKDMDRSITYFYQGRLSTAPRLVEFMYLQDISARNGHGANVTFKRHNLSLHSYTSHG